MKRVLYSIWQVAWGLPQTLAGAIAFLLAQPKQHAWYHGVLACSWQRRSCVSLGLFVFIAEDAIGRDDIASPKHPALRRLLAHEYGHTVQSALFGPLYLLVMGLPSALWSSTPSAKRRRARQGRSYYDFPTERLANRLAEHVLHEPTPR